MRESWTFQMPFLLFVTAQIEGPTEPSAMKQKSGTVSAGYSSFLQHPSCGSSVGGFDGITRISRGCRYIGIFLFDMHKIDCTARRMWGMKYFSSGLSVLFQTALTMSML